MCAIGDKAVVVVVASYRSVTRIPVRFKALIGRYKMQTQFQWEFLSPPIQKYKKVKLEIRLASLSLKDIAHKIEFLGKDSSP